MRLHRLQGSPHFQGTRARAHYATAHPFLTREILASSPITSPSSRERAPSTPRPSHGADDFYTGQATASIAVCNVDAAGRIHNGLPEYDGMHVFKANQPIVELLKRAACCSHAKTSSTRIRIAGAATIPSSSAPPSSGSSRWKPIERTTLRGRRARRDPQGEVGPGVGRRPHRQHGRDPPRLVHLAPAHLGRPHRRLLL